jgi:hypothetical protein
LTGQGVLFFGCPTEVRKITYTASAVQRMRMQLRDIEKELEDAAYRLAESRQPVRHAVRRAPYQRHQLSFYRPRHMSCLAGPALYDGNDRLLQS